VGFQKTDFSISSAFGAGNTKIDFIMRIATFGLYAQAKLTLLYNRFSVAGI
jgi:hypothetical protein